MNLQKGPWGLYDPKPQKLLMERISEKYQSLKESGEVAGRYCRDKFSDVYRWLEKNKETLDSFAQATVVGGIILTGVYFFHVDIEKRAIERKANPHFATVPSEYRSSLALTSGDFDGDGDLDFIVGARSEGCVHLQLYLNDGKGNFKLKKPQ